MEMKKVIFTTIVFCSLFIIGKGQSFSDDKPSKQEKADMKAKQDQQLNDALQELKLTDDQATQVKQALNDALKKSNDLKKDTSLSDDARAAKKDEINSEKNDKLKQIMGPDKYRQWNAIRKRNKELNMGPLGPD
jgi:hypothetical protein